MATVPVSLPAGPHTITSSARATDSGNVNIDSLAVLAPGRVPARQPPTPPAVRVRLGLRGRHRHAAGGAKPAADHNGYSGAGFLAGLEHTGRGRPLTVTGVPRPAPTGCSCATPTRGRRPAGPVAPDHVTAGSATPTTATLAPTSGWDYWRTVSVPVTLAAGTNTVALGCPTDTSCHVNVDTVALATHAAPRCSPRTPRSAATGAAWTASTAVR